MEDPEQGDVAAPWEAPPGETSQKPLPAQEVKTLCGTARQCPAPRKNIWPT